MGRGDGQRSLNSAGRIISKDFLRHTSTTMNTTEFQDESKNRSTSDMKYLVFSGDTDDNNQRKEYSVEFDNYKDSMGATSGFCTAQKLGICVLLQALMLVALAVVIGVHINQTKAETQIRFEKLEGRLINDTENVDSIGSSVQTITLSSEEDQRITLSSKEEQHKPAAGVTYVRWGRTECPDTADLVYVGVAAGGKGGIWIPEPPNVVMDVIGGGSNYLCLTRNPHFNQSVSGEQDTRSRIYGAEYRGAEPGALNIYHMHDAPCVLCQSRAGRTQSFMMPATTHCPTGWTREYSGYLAAARWDHPRTEYVCLDQDPETIPDTAEKDEISLLFHVEIVSSQGLPSEYVTGQDLTCVICTV
ncbi:uncharacterized protein [Amphiura filiformis]|uniref:uncharacterized protein n=1 Tax=Amphiura filiformis TaxID=82378 RepID=UPI003B21FE3E